MIYSRDIYDIVDVNLQFGLLIVVAFQLQMYSL